MPRPTSTPGGAIARRGRTLVEMLVVLTLVGMMAATATPALRDARDGANERPAARVARTLADRLLRARAEAAGRALIVTLVLDPASGRTWRMAGDDAPLVTDTTLPLRVDGAQPVAIAAAGPRPRWTFLPSGIAYGEPVVVRDAAVAIVIDMDPATGAPHVGQR